MPECGTDAGAVAAPPAKDDRPTGVCNDARNAYNRERYAQGKRPRPGACCMSGRSDGEALYGMLSIAVMATIDDLRWTDEAIRLRMMRDLGYPDIKAKRDFDDPADYHAQFSRPGEPDVSYPLGSADDMMYGGRDCGKGFAAVAKALALLAYGYGGVTFGPLRWCAIQMHQRSDRYRPDGQVRRPACAQEEAARLTGEGERHAA